VFGLNGHFTADLCWDENLTRYQARLILSDSHLENLGPGLKFQVFEPENSFSTGLNPIYSCAKQLRTILNIGLDITLKA